MQRCRYPDDLVDLTSGLGKIILTCAFLPKTQHKRNKNNKKTWARACKTKRAVLPRQLIWQQLGQSRLPEHCSWLQRVYPLSGFTTSPILNCRFACAAAGIWFLFLNYGTSGPVDEWLSAPGFEDLGDLKSEFRAESPLTCAFPGRYFCRMFDSCVDNCVQCSPLSAIMHC